MEVGLVVIGPVAEDLGAAASVAVAVVLVVAARREDGENAY